MRITQIRNATLKISYAGRMILTDPWMWGSRPYVQPENSNSGEGSHVGSSLLDGVDAVILTHIHHDMFSPDDGELTGRDDIPVFVGTEEAADMLLSAGFRDVRRAYDPSHADIGGLIISSPMLRDGTCAGGMIISAADKSEKSIFVVGEMLRIDDIVMAAEEYAPGIIMLSSCNVALNKMHFDSLMSRLIVDANDVMEVMHCAPKAIVVAGCIDALADAVREHPELSLFFEDEDFQKRVIIPHGVVEI